MKITFLLTFILGFQLSFGQSVKVYLDALVKSDKTTLEKLTADQVQITMEQQIKSVNRTNAQSILLDFLSNKGIKSYKVIHEGVSKGKETYMGIGNLLSDSIKYRVYLSLSAPAGKTIVTAIRIEEDGL